MAKKHVTAYFMDDRARSAALAKMGTSAQVTDAFVYGEVDEGDIAAMEAAGAIVEQQVTRPRRVPLHPSRVAFAAAGAPGAPPAVDENAVPAEVDYYVMELQGPLIEAWRQQLHEIDARVIQALPSGGYKVRLRLNQVAAVKALPFVESLEWISPGSTSPVLVTQSAMPAFGPPAAGLKMLTLDVRLHQPEDLPTVEQWLKDHHLTISGSSGRKIRFFAAENAPEIGQLQALPEVDLVAEYVEPKLSNDQARVILNIDAAPGHSPPTNLTQDGSGQIVAVADTGIDDTHPDFKGRIVGKVARGRPGDASDPNGHGTHVAGSVLGDGSASGGKVRGAAPKASLFFQSLLDANGGLGGLPVDLNDLFAEAYAAGARIHSNSWGSETPSQYTFSSEEVDEFVASHPDMLIVIAAGNAGTAAQPRNSSAGFVDWLSIGSPASCKNALTVGACRSSRKDGPMAAMTWKSGWPNSFPDPPIAADMIAGDPSCMAAFSGRGPCDDYRIKPDLVAPGTDILSTKSSLAPISHFWGPYPSAAAPDPHYAYDGGTSMATPLVSGCAALVRQYYVQDRNHQPSAALLKATLINSTVWLSGADSLAPKNGIPNYHQGYGRISMDLAIPNQTNPKFKLEFADDWQNHTVSLATTGDRKRYQFSLPAGVPFLRICLAYTDAPARGLQNDLNLMVNHIQSGQKWTGNAKLPDLLTALDTTNNVEKVEIQNPPAGDYVIQVAASNLLKPPQDFALVVTAEQLPALTSI